MGKIGPEATNTETQQRLKTSAVLFLKISELTAAVGQITTAVSPKGQEKLEMRHGEQPQKTKVLIFKVTNGIKSERILNVLQSAAT